jgi:hypothetical protein
LWTLTHHKLCLAITRGATSASGDQFKRGDRSLAKAVDDAIADTRTDKAQAWRDVAAGGLAMS